MQRPPRTRKLGLLGLAAATYFMVSGGPYGLEELVQDCGYPVAITVLLAIPLVWSLPTALMVGELAAAIPAEGGFYVWVRRALGPFWGFQEAWLSLASSVFDMAAYPAVFVLSLGRIWPPAIHGSNGVSDRGRGDADVPAVESLRGRSGGRRLHPVRRCDLESVCGDNGLRPISPPCAARPCGLQ